MCLFLQREECIVCGKKGEKHHIVFKSQNGLDFPLNYVYLCSEHHRGKNGPHKNRIVDIGYKLEMQEKLYKILNKEFYNIEQLMQLLNLNYSQAKTICKKHKLSKEGYKKSEIIKTLMGDTIYYEFMLDEYYDNSWQINEDFENTYFALGE